MSLTYSVLRSGIFSISLSIVSLELTIIVWKLVSAVSVTTVRLFEDDGVSEKVDLLCGQEFKVLYISHSLSSRYFTLQHFL